MENFKDTLLGQENQEVNNKPWTSDYQKPIVEKTPYDNQEIEDESSKLYPDKNSLDEPKSNHEDEDETTEDFDEEEDEDEIDEDDDDDDFNPEPFEEDEDFQEKDIDYIEKRERNSENLNPYL